MTRRFVLLTLTFVLLIDAGLRAQEGALDLTFNATDSGFGSGDGTNGDVNDLVGQTDGKILIGGSFTRSHAERRYRIARLNADGTFDQGFQAYPGANDAVNTFCVQPNGAVLVGGKFTTYHSTARKGIVRVTTTGSLDDTFNPGTGPAGGDIRSIALQADGRIMVGGAFLTFNGIPRKYIARLNGDGSVDTSFDPGSGADGTVEAVRIQNDGRILIAGSFTTYNGTSRSRIARLNADGTLDMSFDPLGGPNNTVLALTLLPDGQMLLAGGFQTYNGVARNGIARLSSSGALDLGFAPGTGANGTIAALSITSNGSIMIGGSFTTFNGTARARIARLTATGGLDVGFNPGTGAPSSILALACLPDGRTVIGGAFLTYRGAVCNHIGQVLVNGDLDATFDRCTGAGGDYLSSTGFPPFIAAMAVQPDDRVVIAGRFSIYNGVARRSVARVNADGSLDMTFDPGPGSSGDVFLFAVALQPDGKIIVGGSFSSMNNVPGTRHLARLNADGSVDASFHSSFAALDGDAVVRGMAIQGDGKIIIGGQFNSYGNVPCGRIVRLNSDGSRDVSFATGSGLSNYPNAIAPQPDGRILLGGSFNNYNGVPNNGLIRLTSNGSLDTGFPNLISSGTVEAIRSRADGKVMVAGTFTSSSAIPRKSLMRLNADGTLDTGFDPGAQAPDAISGLVVQPDGSMLVTGVRTSQTRNSYWRLKADGSLDPTFLSSGAGLDQFIRDLGVTSDGGLILAGDFTSLGEVGRNRLARVHGISSVSIRVDLEGPFLAGGLMNDALRALPSFPLTEPFTALGYTAPGYVSGTTIGSSVLGTAGNDAIVDWVIAEMRPAATPNVIAASRAVLLQRDGDVVDLDGRSSIGFAGLTAGAYCVVIRHRNHLPVMSAPATPVHYGPGASSIDFTLPATAVYDNEARKNINGTMVLTCGDVNFDGTVKYTGANNDRDPILVAIGGSIPTATTSGYKSADVNMDGMVKYTGANNDRDPILVNVGGDLPTATRTASLP